MNLVPGKQLKDRRRAVGGLATLLMVAATPVVAQQTTVIGGDGPESGVTVNLGALDGGSATPRRRSAAPRGEKLKLTPPKRTRQQQPETGSETGFASQRVEAGELVRGPLGILLRFPPLDEPRSQLTVDPDKLARKLDRQQQTAATQGQDDAPELRRPSPKPDTGKTGRAAETQTARQPESGTVPQSSGVQQSSDATEPTMPSAPSDVTAPQPVTPQVTKPAAPEAALDGAGTDTSAGAETQSSQSSQSSDGTSGADTPEANAAQAGPSKTKTEPRTEPDAMASSDTGGAAARSAQQPSESASTESGEPRGTDEAQTQDRTGETQTAKRTPATGNLPDGVRLNFEAASAALPESGRQKLTRLAETLNANPERRVQLMAFAQGGDDGASRARRLSLSRALAVRSFLIDQGIRSTRMDVRALGDTAEGGPLNRVDIVPANR